MPRHCDTSKSTRNFSQHLRVICFKYLKYNNVKCLGFSKVFWEFSKIFLDDYIDRLELEGESKSYICIFLDDDIDRLELEGESKPNKYLSEPSSIFNRQNASKGLSLEFSVTLHLKMRARKISHLLISCLVPEND